jgi:hypothetical protein
LVFGFISEAAQGGIIPPQQALLARADEVIE